MNIVRGYNHTGADQVGVAEGGHVNHCGQGEPSQASRVWSRWPSNCQSMQWLLFEWCFSISDMEHRVSWLLLLHHLSHNRSTWHHRQSTEHKLLYYIQTQRTKWKWMNLKDNLVSRVEANHRECMLAQQRGSEPRHYDMPQQCNITEYSVHPHSLL